MQRSKALFGVDGAGRGVGRRPDGAQRIGPVPRSGTGGARCCAAARQGRRASRSTRKARSARRGRAARVGAQRTPGAPAAWQAAADAPPRPAHPEKGFAAPCGARCALPVPSGASRLWAAQRGAQGSSAALCWPRFLPRKVSAGRYPLPPAPAESGCRPFSSARPRRAPPPDRQRRAGPRLTDPERRAEQPRVRPDSRARTLGPWSPRP